MTEMRYWGEIKVDAELDHIPDVSADIDLSMNNLFLNEFEEEEDSLIKTQKIQVPPLNPLILHAISLHKHANHIVEIIKLTELSKSVDKIEFKLPVCDEAKKSYMSKLNFTSEDFLNFNRGNEVEVYELSKSVVKQILIKCIATLFAHLGYETCQQSALDVLVDVLDDFFRKICHHIKVAIDDKETQQLSGFPHIIERVLTEMGMGGVKALNDYYQSRVVKYIHVLENRCKDLNEEYQALLIPKSPPPVDKFNKMVRVKVEEEDVIEVENPEVHFSTIEGDVNFSILETGYQLLNSLEAEANLQSLGDGVEDIPVTESPGVVSLSSDEMAHLSPYSKKKRYK